MKHAVPHARLTCPHAQRATSTEQLATATAPRAACTARLTTSAAHGAVPHVRLAIASAHGAVAAGPIYSARQVASTEGCSYFECLAVTFLQTEFCLIR